MPVAPDAMPRCPPHLNAVARKEWRRLATPLFEMGVLSVTDRAALAGYCAAWARWVEAEEHLAKGPPLLKTPSGYVQQSPWLGIANKQLEIMARFMAELGLTPSARARLRLPGSATGEGAVSTLQVVMMSADAPSDERQSRDPSRRVITLPPGTDKL